MSQYPLNNLEDLGILIKEMARSSRISVTALVGSTGKTTSSLVALANGHVPNQDANVAPVLRVLAAAEWELVARPCNGDGLTLHREDSLPLYVLGADGAPLEIPARTLQDVAQMICTMALARDRTVSGLVAESGINSGSLITLAKSGGASKDIRFSGLWRLTQFAGFSLYGRPQHRSAREARLAAEVGQYLPRK